MAKKRRNRPSADNSTAAMVAAMTPLVYVMAYAILTVVK